MHNNIGRPAIISVSGNQTLNINSNTEKVLLTCKVAGDNITAYWERLNGPLPSKRNHTYFDAKSNEISLTILRAHPHDSGDFQCIVHSPWGVTERRIVSVLIVAAPPVFTSQPIDEAAVALENVMFTSKAEGFHVTYEWRYYNDDGSYVVKGNNSNLTLLGVTPSDEGHYCCVATTGKGHQAFSSNVTLTVNGNEYQLYLTSQLHACALQILLQYN